MWVHISSFFSFLLSSLTVPTKCGTPVPSPTVKAADGGTMLAGDNVGTTTTVAADWSERAVTLESRSSMSTPG